LIEPAQLPRAAASAPPWSSLEPGAQGWPRRFAHLHRAPSRLWVLGAADLDRPGVAVVGSRGATAGGLDIATQLGREIAAAGMVVISGMARGIDAAAHRGALEAGGTTVAVLGCGIDICYPPEHDLLRHEIAASGAVVSEFAPGSEPLPARFPQRNRLIAALSEAVVVVEAAERSGALSTARHAADLGREVLAVPGSIRSAASAGTNRLIRDGATPFLEMGDLWSALSVLPLKGHPVDAEPAGRDQARLACLDPPLREVLLALGADALHPDELGASLGISASQLGSRLSVLELGGWVERLPGGLVGRLER
jgi:DNA processing protein